MSDARTGDPEDQQAQEPLTPRKRGLFRRGEDGLTTLEWLLIVAAVAGLAALAVVLVQNVVDETAEQIGGSSARKTAARVAATSITSKAREDVPEFESADAAAEANWNSMANEYEDACNRLEITYGDVDDLTVTWHEPDFPGTAPADQPTTLTAWQALLKTTEDRQGCKVT